MPLLSHHVWWRDTECSTCLYGRFNPYMSGWYCGQTTQGRQQRQRQHCASILRSWTEGEIPAYDVMWRTGIGRWISLPLLDLSRSTRFELMQFERDVIQRFMPKLNTPFIWKNTTQRGFHFNKKEIEFPIHSTKMKKEKAILCQEKTP